ncbi:MAG: hypothetical protein U0930_20060 [Pirellulales bacterium]
MKCTLASGQVYYSNEVTVTVCTNHSYWFRWHKNASRTEVSWIDRGAYLEQVGSFWVVRSIYDETFGLSTGAGIWYQYPENFPTPYGCSSDRTTNRSGVCKVYSYNNKTTTVRSGYSFDYRYLFDVVAPGCGSNTSITQIFPSRGLVSLGHVTITQTLDIDFTEIGSIGVAWTSGTLSTVTPLAPSTGVNYSHTESGVHDADVSLWLPPFSMSPIAWPDGSTTPPLTFDSTGNTIGLMIDNRTTSSSASGTKFPLNSCAIDPYQFVATAANSIFTFTKRVFGWGPTEYILRTCAQANAGTNSLPPASVNANDVCGILEFGTTGSSCVP